MAPLPSVAHALQQAERLRALFSPQEWPWERVSPGDRYVELRLGQETYDLTYLQGADFDFARAQGWVFENPRLAELPPGAYTFVVTRSGRWVFGQVVDGAEFGVKHFQLAQGEAVVAAGEVFISETGPIRINHASGTFTGKMEQEVPELGARMLRHLRGLFEEEFPGRTLLFHSHRTSLLPSERPFDGERLRRICGDLPGARVRLGPFCP